MPSPTRSQAVSRPLKRVIHPSQRSILRLVWQELLALFFGFLLLIPIWLLIGILLPISLFAGWCLDVFVSIFLRNRYPGFCRVAPWDAVWLGNSDPKTPPLTTTLITLQKGMTFQEIKSLILDRMVLAKDDGENLMYPRFMQKIVKVAGINAWVFEGEFDPTKHFALVPNEVSTPEALRLYITELGRTALPLNRPLWMLHVQTNFGADGDSILLFRYHQSMSDGISLVKILCRSITDKTQNVYHIKSRFGGINFSINTIRSVLMAGVFFMTKILFHASPDWKRIHNPFRSTCVMVGSNKKVAAVVPRRSEVYWADLVSLRALDRISMVTRNSLHNVLLSCLSGALRTCFTDGGAQRVTSVRASIPVDLRRPLASVTNPIEMAVIGSIPRLWKIRNEEDQLKNTSNTTSMYWIIQILGHIIPVSMLKSLLARSVTACCTVSNVPGPDAQLFLEEKPIKSIFFWPPSISSRNLLSVSFFTYAEQLCMGLAADPDVCDAKVLASEFSHQVSELSDLLANRRAPGEVKRRHSESREPLQNLRSRILEVQRALLEAQIAASSASVQKNQEAWSENAAKVEMLKEELMEMLSLARRRKSVVEGVSMDFEEDEDMQNEFRSGMMSPRRRASSVSSVESVRVLAVTPTRFSGSHEMRESVATSVSRSRTYSNMSEEHSSSNSRNNAKVSENWAEQANVPANKRELFLQKIPHTHVIYVTRDNESNDSAQID